jgi:hypothetical protein
VDKQVEKIALIINKYNKKADIKIDGYRVSHLPISFEECLSCAKAIQVSYKLHKDGSKFGLMDKEKVLTNLAKLRGQFKKSIDLINELPIALKLPSRHFEMMEKLGLDSENTQPILDYYRDNLGTFDDIYDLLVKSIKEENIKKSKINKEVLAVIKQSVVIWRTILHRKRPKYINRGNANDEITNYLSEILKTFNLEPDIDNAYRNYLKWREGKL